MRTSLTAMAACLSLVGHGTPARPVAAWAQGAAPSLARDTAWVKRGAIYEVFVRDFSPTGNFRGVARGLDRIQAVGADVVWLMPIHPVGVLNRKGPSDPRTRCATTAPSTLSSAPPRISGLSSRRCTLAE